jgi:beta-lactamase class A
MVSSATRWGSCVVLALLLAACSGPGLSPSATPVVPSPTPTEDAGQAQDAPTSTSTIEPSATPTEMSEATPTDPPATPTRPDPTPTSTADSATPERAGPTRTPGDPEAPDGDRTPKDFSAEVEALLGEREGHYHVVVIGPGGEPQYRLNDGVQLQAASLFKLLIMVEVFKQEADGWISFEDQVVLHSGFFSEAGYDDPFGPERIGDTATVEELVGPMVMFSSNVAAYALLDLVGNTNINATVAALGMTSSEIRWMPRRVVQGNARDLAQASPESQETPPPTADEAFNVTSAADMALLFDLLLKGQVVSPEASEKMLELLTGQVVNNRLPALLPAGTVVAHKTGNIDNVVHDVGVIYTPSGPAVVVVLTADAIEWQAIEFMQELALLVYETAGG